MDEFFRDLLGIGAGEALGGAAALGLLGSAYERLGDIGERGLGLGEELAQRQIEQAAFRPYTTTKVWRCWSVLSTSCYAYW